MVRTGPERRQRSATSPRARSSWRSTAGGHRGTPTWLLPTATIVAVVVSVLTVIGMMGGQPQSAACRRRPLHRRLAGLRRRLLPNAISTAGDSAGHVGHARRTRADERPGEGGSRAARFLPTGVRSANRGGGDDQRYPTHGLSGGEQVLAERGVERRGALARERCLEALEVERAVRQSRLQELGGVQVEELDLGSAV